MGLNVLANMFFLRKRKGRGSLNVVALSTGAFAYRLRATCFPGTWLGAQSGPQRHRTSVGAWGLLLRVIWSSKCVGPQCLPWIAFPQGVPESKRPTRSGQTMTGFRVAS